MTKIMTATEMTDDQIEDAVNKLRDAMHKHRSEIPSDIAKQVLSFKNLGIMMLAPFRNWTEAVSSCIINPITRKVKVYRSRSPQEALDATGCYVGGDRDVIDSMPEGEGDEVEIMFFKPDLSNYGGLISDDDLERLLELYDLKLASPIFVATMNEDDHSLAIENPHATHWKNNDGNWCCSYYHSFNNGRQVNNILSNYKWSKVWSFPCVRK